ncbi:MAG: hypothetical protein JWM33_402, partial [Caulobacteraceae bacterium]|nr:hypothetical protein [Caulobacteraceae bacterium]
VGLNPTGALGETAPAADPSKVVVAGDTLEARSALETSILNEYWAATGRTDNSISLDEMAKVLSPARYQAFLENDERLGVLRKAQARADALARGDFNAVRAFDHLPVAGPDSFVVPSGMSVKEAAQALGLDSDLGYAIDGAAVAATKTLVLVKCFTPTTPVSANACKYL